MIAALLVAVGSVAAQTPSVAFHYGAEPPARLLSVFDWVVLDPAASTAVAELSPAVPIAYVAATQLHPSAPRSELAPETARVGFSPAWGSHVMDPAHPEWQAHLLERVLPELWEAGFRGFFFDAMDGFRGHVDEEASRWEALGSFLKQVDRRFPGAVVVVNRGFEILPGLKGVVDAVAAESLFGGFEVRGHIYRPVPEADRRWLGERLLEAKSLGFVTIAIDYLPARDHPERRRLAERIADAGHVPWVGPGSLDGMGVGALEVLPRDVVLLFDSKVQAHPTLSTSLRLLALPLEYLGLVPRMVDIRGELPRRSLAGEVAGVVGWLGEAPLERPQALRRFLARQLDDGVPVVVFGALAELAEPGLLRRLGLRTGAALASDGLTVTHAHPGLGFEAPLDPVLYEVSPLWGEGPGFAPWLELQAHGARYQPLLVAPWGGLALQPFAVDATAGEGRWILDPFAFLKAALRLEAAPIVDPTTENGRRVLVTHIDGDGAASRTEEPGHPSALRVIRRWVETQGFPHTVSVVEGELRGAGPEAKALRAEARRMFALPHVEPASHGFSHPFEWRAFEAGGGRHLEVRGGHPTLERELLGSVRYVAKLAGRPVELFLWTGDAMPTAASASILSEAGLANMNGGFTVATRDRPSVVHVAPRGVPVLGESEHRWGEVGFQTYAPMMNENVFTNGWKGPFWGFRRLRETFAFTESPRRLAPLGIYYHFFSATRKAGLRALEQVYQSALAAHPLPIAGSRWVKKVLGARSAVLVRALDGTHVVRGMSDVRTLRLPEGLGPLSSDRSLGIVGERTLEAGRFVFGDGRDRLVIAYGRARSGPSLIEASAALASVASTKDAVVWRFEGPAPVVVHVRDCGQTRRVLRASLELKCRVEAR